MRPRGAEIDAWRAWRSGRGGPFYRWLKADEQDGGQPRLLPSTFTVLRAIKAEIRFSD